MFDPNDAKQLALEIEKIYKRIGLSNPFSSGIHTISELKNGLEEARDILLEWDEGVGDIERGFRSILNEVKTTGNSFNMVKRSLTSITSISSQIRDHQLGINQLSSKQLTQYKSKLASEATTLSNNVKALQDEKDILDAKTRLDKTERSRLAQLNVLISNTTGLLRDQDSIQKLLNEKLDQEIQQRETIEKKLGVVGGMLRGISKIPILGDLVDTNEALHVAESTIELTESSVRGLGAAMGNLGKQAISGLLNPANLVLGAFTIMAKVLKDLDSSAGKYAKSMNVTYGEALNVREELSRMASSSSDTSLNATNLQETLMAVGSAMGSNAKLNEADLKTFTKLREQAGFTSDELMEIQKLSLVNNKTLEANTKEILGAAKAYNSKNKLALNEKQILKDVNAASASLKLSLGGSSTQLAVAASKARELGLNLQQTEKIAESLLNFESSIEAELSAELLTGRDLNLEQARLLALNGKTAEAAAEIARQVGTSADFTNMNVIAQESLAKVAGMTRDEFAQSLIDKESLAKLGVKEAKSAQEAYNMLKSRGMSEAAIQKKLGDEELARQYQQQSVQERFEQTLLHIKEIFISIADGPLGSMLSIMGKLMENTAAVYTTFGLISSLWAGKMLMNLGKLVIQLGTAVGLSSAKAIAEVTAAEALTMGAATIGIVAGLATVGGLMYSMMSPKKVGDMQYDNKTGQTTISTKEGGLYSISDNDQINVHPELKPSNNRLSPPSNTSMNYDAFLMKMEKHFSKLDNLDKMQDRPVVVHSTVRLPNGEAIARSTNEENRKGWRAIQ